MRILVDAMGGDHAPKQIVLGALDAAKSQKVLVMIVTQVKLMRNSVQILFQILSSCWRDTVSRNLPTIFILANLMLRLRLPIVRWRQVMSVL